jgi:hypothetical protein
LLTDRVLGVHRRRGQVSRELVNLERLQAGSDLRQHCDQLYFSIIVYF